MIAPLEEAVMDLIDSIQAQFNEATEASGPLEGIALVTFGDKRKDEELQFPSMAFTMLDYVPIPDITTSERQDIPFQFFVLTNDLDPQIGQKAALQWILKARDLIYSKPDLNGQVDDITVVRIFTPRIIAGANATMYGSAMNVNYTIMI